MMKHLLLLTTLVGVTFANDLPAIKPGCPPPTCLDNNENILFPHADQTLFYQCAPIGHEEFGPIEVACPGELWFSYEEQVCVFPVNWRGVCGEYVTTTVAPQLCGEPRCDTEEQILTLHPAEDPAFFYQCTYRFGEVYEPKKMPCAPGTLFDFDQQVCVNPNEWSDVCNKGLITSPVTPPTGQPGGACPAPLCETQAEFGKLHPAENPKNYYECNNGNSEAILRSCPSGLFFGYKQQTCVQQCFWEDSCTESQSTTTTQSPTSTTPPSTTSSPTTTTATSPMDKCLAPLCKLQAELNVKHPAVNPIQYYVCEFDPSINDFVPVLNNCPSGLFFGNDQQECVAPCYWQDTCAEDLTTSPTSSTSNSTPSSTTGTPIGTPPITTIPTTTTDETTPSSTISPNSTTGTTRTTPTTTQTTAAPVEFCSEPTCYSADEIARLHPSKNPQDFFECVSQGNGWHVAVLRTCDAGQLFGYRDQKCVDACDWEDVCRGEQTGTTPVTPPSVTPPFEGSCDVPACNSEWELATLHPSRDPQNFYQCTPNNAVLMTCPAGLWFGFDQQVCVWPSEWKDACGEHTGTTPVTPEDTTTAPLLPPSGSCSEPDCKNVLNLLKLYPANDPTSYYQCTLKPSGGYEVVLRKCSFGLLFSDHFQSCVLQSLWTDACNNTETTTNEPPTTTTELATTETPNNCDVPACNSEWELVTLHPSRDPQNFYQCTPNNAVLMTCPAGLWFGFDQQVCVWPSEWKDACGEHTGTTPVTPEDTTTAPILPPSGSCSEPDCKNVLDLLKLYPANDPTSYYQCTLNPSGGYEVVLRKCSFGLLFSDHFQSCVLQSLWTDACNNTETTTNEPPTTTTELATTETPNNCDVPACNSEWELATLHPSRDPQNFYQCTPNNAVLMTCPAGLWFGFDQQVCVWPSEWKDACGEHTGTTPVTPEDTTTAPILPPSGSCSEPDCKNVLDLLKLYPANDPTSYYQCTLKPSGGYEVVLRKCSFGLLFSDHFQSCVLQSLWTDACNNTETTTNEPPTTTTELATTETPNNCDVPACNSEWELATLHPSRDPQNFYQCTPNNAVLMTCPAGLWFGFDQQVCVWPSEWKDACGEHTGTTPVTPEDTTTAPILPPSGSCSEPDCKNVLDLLKLYPANDPTSYYQCTLKPSGGYEVVLRKCSFGLLFSDHFQSCVLQSLWTDACNNTETTTNEPPITTTEQTTTEEFITLPAPACGEVPDCDQPALRVLHPAAVSVSSFYRCEPVLNRFEAVLRECSQGTWFSFWKQECVWPANWESACGNEIITTTEMPATTTISIEVTTTTAGSVTLPAPACGEVPDCNQPALRVLHPAAVSVSSFYRCEPVLNRFEAVLRECSQGTWFSFWKQECVWPANWESACGNEIITTTEMPATTTISIEVTTTTADSVTLPTPSCGEAPDCDQPALRVLHPSRNVESFYRCEPSGNNFVANLRHCLTGTWFSFQHQLCVWPSEYVSVCDSITEPPPAEMCQAPLCDDHVDRLYPNKNSQWYYRCALRENSDNLYEAVVEICPEGTWFGALQQECVPTCDWVDQCESWSRL